MKPLTPQEVRIGNLTSHGVVWNIDKDVLSTVKDGKIYHSIYTPIYPVPLTPEILEGFGFEYIGNYGVMKLVVPSGDDNDYEIHYVDKRIHLHSEDCDQCMFLGEIHAHTLQNFVQSISGVELVYKQKPNNTK